MFTDEHEMLRRTVRAFVEKEVAPHVDAWEEAGRIPREFWRRLGELGLLGLEFPVEYGGGGGDFLSSVVLGEEMARCRSGGVAFSVLVHTDMSSPWLTRYGTEAQKRAYLPGIVRGETVCALGITEPGTGSDMAGIATRAVRDGDRYLLTGSKIFITNGVYGDLYFVAARTGPGTAGPPPRRHLDVPRRGRDARLHGEPAARQDGHARLRHRGAVLPGVRGAVLQPARRGGARLPPARRRPAARAHHGRGARALAARPRRSTTRSRTCASATPSAGRSATSRCCATGSPTWPPRSRRPATSSTTRPASTPRGGECVTEVSMAKLFATEVANRVAYQAVQLHGGYGYMREFGVERFFRDVRLWTIASGTSEIMREIIAKRLLS